MSGNPDSERYLREARERIKRRSAAWMALAIGPFILVLLAIKVFEDHTYPPGDFRNEPVFWIAFGLGAVLLIATMMVGAIRSLVRGE
jgi:hypothetical protein